MENKKKKKIIWIDDKVDNIENTYTYEEFTTNLPEYDIIKAKSVKQAFHHIEKNYEDFKFKLFYVIVSGTLSEDFFREYVKKSLELHILCATIIYCSEKNRKLNEFKPFYLDNFLNPGKVTDSSYFVIEYIKSVQCSYYLEPNELINEQKEKVEEKKEKIESNDFEENKNKNDIEFAAEFSYIKDLGTMAYPIIISKYINCTLIEKGDIEIMQKENIKLFPKLKHLFKPSEEKDIFIPYYILAKYYLNIYTQNSNFYVDMNRELRERKFDKYKTYIYLMYNALNKGIFKSYCKSNLYRGGTLSNEEYESLKEKIELKQKGENSETNKIFFFSRKFLSFSKVEEVAKVFLQTAIFCNYTGVYVLFIVEGTEDDDFFVSNIDINEMKLSNFSDEEEVLFLPLSCFEVISIQDEDFFGHQIKVIRLNYLNKYKKVITENFEKILKEEDNQKLQKFIEDGINSKYSKGICKYLGKDFNQKFYDEVSQKTNTKINRQPQFIFQYKNSNPLGKKFIINPEFAEKLKNKENSEVLLRNAEKLIDNLNTKISYYRFGKYKGKDCIACYGEKDDLLYFDDGDKCFVPSINDQLEIVPNDNIVEDSILDPELYHSDNFTVGRIAKQLNKLQKSKKDNQNIISKNDIKKYLDLKENKIKYKQSGAIEANIVGNILGHFLANYSKFKNADKKGKVNMIIYDAIIPISTFLGKKKLGSLPIFKNTVLGSIFRNGFIILNIFELCRSFYDVFFSDVLTPGEKISIIGKKTSGVIADILGAGIGQTAGMKLALCLGFVAGPGAIIIGGIAGLAFGFISGKIVGKLNEEEEKRETIFYSDSLYFKYIPKKYREFCIPTMKWKNSPLASKSFAIELIVDEDGKNPNWLVINIPAKPKEMEINELSKEGETIIKYKGIPENAFSGCFFLYAFDIKSINYNEFKIMKDGLKEGENLRSHLIDYKILIAS